MNEMNVRASISRSLYARINTTKRAYNFIIKM